MSHVLIIEDEAALASALSILMQRLGHTTATAASATLGLQRLGERRPDLVVLDIGLPDRSGLVALDEIRAHDATIPVLMVTAHGNLQNAVQARKGGASAYLVKPLDLGELERTVRSLLQSSAALPTSPPPVPANGSGAPLLIGSSAAMQPAFTAIAHACASDAPVLITGPTGIGKSWLACALANQACRLGFNALYVRLSRFLPELVIARADGRYAKQINTLAKTDLLVLDDFGSARLSEEHRRDLLEILDDRYGARATLVTSQFPIEKWHDLIGDPTLSDAILDRLVHNAYKLALKGDSLRKQRQALTQTGHCDA